MKSFAKKLFNQLQDKKKHEYVIIPYYSHEGEHQCFIKYTQIEGDYYRTLYNAGAIFSDDELKLDKEDQVHCIVVRLY